MRSDARRASKSFARLSSSARTRNGPFVPTLSPDEANECRSLGLLSHLYLSLSLPSHSHTLLSSSTTLSWTSDSLLSQLLTARTNLALGPTSKYQEAYYVYEEIKGMQGGRGEGTLAGVAVAQGLLGRWEEAGQAVNEALEIVSCKFVRA